MKKLTINDLYGLVGTVSDALNTGDIDDACDIINKKLEELNFETRVTCDELSKLTQKLVYDLEVVLVGADNIIFQILKKEGFTVFNSGRSVILITDCSRKSERFKNTIQGVCLYIIGDPDSGLLEIDTMFVSGYRFGLNVLTVNEDVLIDVHKNYNNKVIDTLINHLINNLIAESLILEKKEDEEKLVIVKNAISTLKSVRELFHEHIT